MKNLLTLAVLMIAVLGCDISKFISSKNENLNAAKPSPTVESKPSPSASPTRKPTPAEPGLIAFLKKSVGKYPYEVKLLNNAELKGRLKNLLGKDFAAMDKYFDVQSPMEVVNDVLMTTGCESHNCGANQYLLFIDLKNDNINVFHVGDDGTKHYFEHGEISLPKKFADQIAANN